MPPLAHQQCFTPQVLEAEEHHHLSTHLLLTDLPTQLLLLQLLVFVQLHGAHARSEPAPQHLLLMP